LRLDAVEGGRGLEEVPLKVILVHGSAVDTEIDQHLCDVLEQTAIDHFASPFPLNPGQDGLQQSVLDPRRTRDVVPVSVKEHKLGASLKKRTAH
jgi:hypothetical protein